LETKVIVGLMTVNGLQTWIIDSAEMYIVAVENIVLFKKFYEVDVR